MAKHLIFYDGECGFCDCAVQFVLNHDSKALFNFAPLQGKTAEEKLNQLPFQQKNLDSLILIENYKEPNARFYILGKAAFRICWLLGNHWTIPGLLSFLPSFLYDWGYRLIARNRHRLFKNTSCVVPSKEKRSRFLP